MKKLFFVFTLLFSYHLFAQSYPFKITGTIQSEKDQKVIEAATIHLEKLKDSTILSYTISDDKGFFILEGKTFHKEVKLFISFIGLKSFSKNLKLKEKAFFNLGIINLKEEKTILNEVIIKSRAPITIKKDTLEFNVKSFKTKKNANVEDLLKKLPGIEVDQQGKITVNGKPVKNILVNGKPFFSNDLTIATRNLSKEIIEKVQIVDTKSKSEAFTGEKSNGNNKTINLTIKKERNKGWFGELSANTGTNKRYETTSIINHFNNDTKISLLLNTSNINSSSFSNGLGNIKSKDAGITYGDTFKKGFNVNFNYFYTGNSSNNDTKNNRENILPDTRYFSSTTTSNFNEDDGHSLHTDFDIEIDSTLLINLSPRLSINKRKGNYIRTETSLNNQKKLINTSKTNFRSISSTNNFHNTINITKRLNNKGSFVKTFISYQIDQEEVENYNIYTIQIFDLNPSIENRNQLSKIDNKSANLNTRFSYRYPLISKKLFLDIKYNYSQFKRENINSTLDFNSDTNTYTVFNSTLSSNFSSDDITKTPSLGIFYNSKKWHFNFTSGYMNKTLKNKDILRPELNFIKDFNLLQLQSYFRYQFNTKASMYFSYKLENKTPDIKQLQPFTDITNPLNIVTGNPSLKPIEIHQFKINFNQYNWQNRTNFFFYFGANLKNNQVVSKSSINKSLVRTTTYNNVNGTYNFWGGGSYNKQLKLDSISYIELGFENYINHSKNVNFFNDIKYNSYTTTLSPKIRATFNWKELLYIEPSYSISFSKNKYDLDNFNNQNFTRHDLNINTRTSFPKKLEWINDIIYTYNSNVIAFNKSSWFWNTSLAYSILNDKATITFKVYDLLNQNNNVRRIATNNYIEDSESTVLQQYFMLGFSWIFNSLGKKKNSNEFNF